MLSRRRSIFLSCLGLLAIPMTSGAQLVRSAAGTNAAAITPTRDAFRVDLGGGTVAGPNGSFGGLRREINWDGVPDGFSAPNNLPANFFNVNSPRGVIFTTPGTGFQVSADASNPTSTPTEFDNINITYHRHFEPFSAERLFTALGSNVLDVTFFIPGTSTPTLTRGFGSIFTDVDLANTTSIEFFDAANASLGTFFVPNVAGGAETFSFLGVSYATAIISRVRITNGNTALGAGVDDQNGNANDLVGMDDFLYGEPLAVPEPSTYALFGVGGLFVVSRLRRRRR